MPHIEIEPETTEIIIDLARDSANTESRRFLVDEWMHNHKFADSVARGLSEPPEKALSKLGVTYGALRRLGFSEERVEECLRTINGVDLEEAYDWVRPIFAYYLVL